VILGRFTRTFWDSRQFANCRSLWGIYLVSENATALDDLVHFTLREWSRLSFNVSPAEVERAKAQLRASILLGLDGTTAVAEDIGRQIVTTGRRLTPQDIERVIERITEKDVMDFAQRKLWDQEIAISAVGKIEGLLGKLDLLSINIHEQPC
jgi:processing peptidase subunit beta